MEKKENFYLFLDIDGVMWDWQWKLSEIKKGNIKEGIPLTSFNPESVVALNTLIEYLQRDYDFNLVISSTWRANLPITVATLRKNKVNLPQSISKTQFFKAPKGRGKQITTYLQGKRDPQNYLVIDDKPHDFEECLDPSRIIKTNVYDKSLRLEDVNKWITARENNLNQLKFE